MRLTFLLSLAFYIILARALSALSTVQTPEKIKAHGPFLFYGID